MREILFRGKDVRTGYWKEGSLVREWLGVDIGYTIRDVPDRFNQIAFRSIVDPKTVGQFTGLTDKNGKKIFEGDIVKYKEHILQVEYADEYAIYFFHNNGSVIGECTAKYTKEYAEIIGNIHDNPELLEGNK